MQNRRAIILESIKKLLKLGISDPEIVLHLEEVGVKEPEARELIAEAKGMPRSEIPTSSSSSTVLQEIKEEIQETPLEREIDFPIFPEPEPEP
ncbi:hypothetical protein KJ972_06055, partial [Candidatus Micrarchaeota archaeon]|nr:hypothetical protein [Candidatus Micrarchaeota archaeon]